MVTPLRICVRTVCSTSALNVDMVMKQAEMLKRMVDRSLKKKLQPKNSVLLSKSNIMSPYENENCTPRMVMLNKMYMQNIIPMLNSGKCGSMLSELSIEISKVQITKCLKFLNVFWITRNTDLPEDSIEEVLQEVLREVQKEVGTLRFMTQIPLLRFVNDKRLQGEIKLEKVFEKADYGPDYEPIYMRKVFTPTFNPETIKAPKMEENILGLDHEKIIKKIKADIFRFKAVNINMNEKTCETDERKHKHVSPEKLIPFNRHDFYKFYKRRRSWALKKLKKGDYDD